MSKVRIDRIGAQTVFYGDRVEFYLGGRDDTGGKVASRLEWSNHEEGDYCEPSFSLPMEIAQKLFQQLWAQGFRSPHDKGSAEALDAARREHISDLRKAAKLEPKSA